MSKFIGVDGEGLTRADDSHDYTLLAATGGWYIENWERGLSSRECFDFLIALRQAFPDKIFVGFSFTYDVNMMLGDLTRIYLERLHEHNQVGWIPEPLVKYVLNFVPSKWFQVSRFRRKPNNPVWQRDGSIKIWDVFGFYQSAFLAAIKDWKVATDAQIAEIKAMKEKRGGFAENERDEIRHYCFEECDLLVKLVEQLDDALIESDLEIKQYHGAGSIANTMLKRHKAKDYILRRPGHDFIWNAILTAYFGGRVETLWAGFIDQTVYSYDINSAYPSATRFLPDMQGGKWEYRSEYDPRISYALWHVQWGFSGGRPLIPFPYRRDKSIYYVTKGEGWYHAPEIRAAHETGAAFEVIEGISFTPANDARPFAWVEDVYELRRALKAAGDKREKALKLGINSLYGKFAQSVSAHDKPGQYQCYFYAGYITSYCRAEILRAASKAPQDILAIATDGILSLAPLDLPIGKKLGEWEYKEPITDGILIVQPGFIVSRYEQLVRTRGMAKSSVAFDTFMQAWKERGVTAKVAAKDKRFISLGRALAMSHNDAELQAIWRRWKDIDIDMSFFPARKLPALDDTSWSGGGSVKLYPTFPFDDFRISDRYTPRIGANIDAESEPVEYVDRLEIIR